MEWHFREACEGGDPYGYSKVTSQFSTFDVGDMAFRYGFYLLLTNYPGHAPGPYRRRVVFPDSSVSYRPRPFSYVDWGRLTQ